MKIIIEFGVKAEATPPNQPHQMKTIPLEKFRHNTRATIAKLKGLRSIMRVVYARKIEWYLVIPAVWNEDANCILIHKEDSHLKLGWHYIQTKLEPRLIRQEKERIVDKSA